MRVARLDTVQTARMVCERAQPGDMRELLSLLCDPRVARTLSPTGRPPSEAVVRAGLETKLEHWRRFGFGLWMLRDRVTGELVGRGGLQHTFVEDFQDIEVGWAIVPERWGQGLATELAQASIEVAFGPLGLPHVVAFTLPGNIASRKVMEKTGFAYEREVEHVGRPHLLYIRRSDQHLS